MAQAKKLLLICVIWNCVITSHNYTEERSNSQKQPQNSRQTASVLLFVPELIGQYWAVRFRQGITLQYSHLFVVGTILLLQHTPSPYPCCKFVGVMLKFLTLIDSGHLSCRSHVCGHVLVLGRRTPWRPCPYLHTSANCLHFLWTVLSTESVVFSVESTNS